MAGKNIANPMGAISTAAMMLAHLGCAREAAQIEAAVTAAVHAEKTTADIGGKLGTREVGEWIASAAAKS
jgi:isocitrate/isopropylmalate dehydrogenase